MIKRVACRFFEQLRCPLPSSEGTDLLSAAGPQRLGDTTRGTGSLVVAALISCGALAVLSQASDVALLLQGFTTVELLTSWKAFL